ncbi:hypothetical protein [Hymenobacter nivis]|nr:hypothetical protein [Hymenobacter nivis]
MTTISEVTEALEKEEKLIIAFAKDWSKEKYPFLPAGISLFYLWLILFSLKEESTVIEEFEKVSFDEPSSKLAKELIIIAERIRRKLNKGNLN